MNKNSRLDKQKIEHQLNDRFLHTAGFITLWNFEPATGNLVMLTISGRDSGAQIFRTPNCA